MLDDVTTSTAPGVPPLASFTAPPNSHNQHAPAQAHNKPNRTRTKRGKGAQKRKASEALPPLEPPKPPKIQKVGEGSSNTGGPGAANIQGKSKKSKNKKKKKGKTNLNGQPRPSNLHHEEGEVEGEDVGDGDHIYEDGEVVYDGFGFGSEPGHDPKHPSLGKSIW
jgi:hypothetical protein